MSSELSEQAAALDQADPLAPWRAKFLFPRRADGRDVAYFCGNSLGLQPRRARTYVDEVLGKWASEAVEAHFTAPGAWMPYHELLTADLARLAGAKPIEVVAMNSLTVNLHLMLASFYRPTRTRYAIAIEAGAFPSDRHAVVSHLRWAGMDPASALIEVAPGPDGLWSMERWTECMARDGERIALMLLPGVHYVTGERFDLAALTALAHRHGARIGFDLAHAIGNVPVDLHQAGPDFAVWCSYKYLNAGPGAVAGCFVHQRHAERDLPRLAGWWGHRKDTRFLMGPEFVPIPGAEGWQLSNPPILAMAPLRASLELFTAADLAALRQKSVALTGFLAQAVERLLGERIAILTPSDPERRGCQLSLRWRAGRERGRAAFEALLARGIVCDWREPDVIRVAPTPLYTRYADVAELIAALCAIEAVA